MKKNICLVFVVCLMSCVNNNNKESGDKHLDQVCHKFCGDKTFTTFISHLGNGTFTFVCECSDYRQTQIFEP